MQAIYNPDPATSISNVKDELQLIKQAGCFDPLVIEKCIRVLERTELRIEDQAKRISQSLTSRLTGLFEDVINDDWSEDNLAL